MPLETVPIILILAGLTAYTVLGGADFGAGFWRLTARRSGGDAIREHTENSIAPVWEANHVWLIFVLVVCWTAYPTAFGSIASTLAAPLLLAAVGIILRGTAYAMHGRGGEASERAIGDVFGVASVLTPFALGAAIGGIASGRVPVGNASGDLIDSWLNPTSLEIGALAVATAAYLAAVWLAADAARIGRPDLARAFRARAMGAGVVAGAIALLGLLVVKEDAPALWDGLSGGAGLAAVLASAAAGVITLGLVWGGRFEPARYSAAVAVAAIIAGWAFAQEPNILPGLSVSDAAAGDATLTALLISIGAGLIVLVPSLALLFGLVLGGRFDPGAARAGEPQAPTEAGSDRAVPIGAASTLFVAGALITVVSEGGWSRIVGILALLAGVALVCVALLSPAALEEAAGDPQGADGGERGVY